MKRYFCCCFLLAALLSFPAEASGAPVSRGELILLMWRCAGSVPFDMTAHPFTDLEGADQVAQTVAWAWDLGLVKGVGGSLFAPERPLTREECALLLRRWDALLGREVFLPDGAAACNDFADISPWADDSLYWACITGRMAWREGRFAPLEGVCLQELERCFAFELALYPPSPRDY